MNVSPRNTKKMPKILFPNNLLEAQKPNPDYQIEVDSVKALGMSMGVIGLEDVEMGDFVRGVARVRREDVPTKAIYRGWMMTPTQYKGLYRALQAKNIKLINSPEAYQHCHYFVESYDKIREYTPLSVSIKVGERPNFEEIFEKISVFGEQPIIVKDYVKSEKHAWKEACFMPNAQDKENVKRITERFMELRGSYFNEGLVYRKFEELAAIGAHPKSGMPLTKEFRLFFLYGQLIAQSKYWEDIDYKADNVDFAPFKTIAQTIESNFFTMDIAQRKNGEWIIMELGDGQVSGLPNSIDATNFFNHLKNIDIHF